jgi:hypothetical protein
MKFDKWIAIVAIVAIPAISSCRKSRSTSQNNAAKQDATGAHVEPQRVLSKDEQSCNEFVHKFYDWYLHREWSDLCKGSHDSADCKKAAEFGSIEGMSEGRALSAKLQKLFADDRAAEATANEDARGYLEEHDFYLPTGEDPSSRYEVENVRVKDGVCKADVNGESEASGEKAKVMPVLANSQGKWVFVDFHYYYDVYDEKAKKNVLYDEDLVRSLTDDLKGFREEIKGTKK